MSWSRAQVIMAGTAARLAGWNSPQRYIALRHAGCLNLPRARAKGGEPPRPSLTHPANGNREFEAFMALAEACALGRGERAADFPRPANEGSWVAVEARVSARTVAWIVSVWDELAGLIPDVFGDMPGNPAPRAGLLGFVRRQTMSDDAALTFGRKPSALEECDGGQLYRIGEGLKAWGTRECLRRGITPTRFTLNRREVERQAAHTASA